MKTVKKTYSTTQEILYTVCLAAWKLCSDNLAKFTALKAFYTEPFVTNAVQAVNDAKQLPESRVTIAGRKEARINLANSTRQVRSNWQTLKVYITKAFPQNIVKAKLDAAGAALYAKASVDNWSAVRSLIDTANVFIDSNLAELTANENMPANFQATFKSAGDSCIEFSVVYARMNMEKQVATSGKIDANNAIYATVIEMLKDGQQIFKDDVSSKRQFTFSYLVSIHRGERPASLRGKIVNTLNTPVESAIIASQDGKYTATTNRKGHYRINRIAAGTYTFTITCPGYEAVVQEITFVAGKASKGDFAMSNILMKVA